MHSIQIMCKKDKFFSQKMLDNSSMFMLFLNLDAIQNDAFVESQCMHLQISGERGEPRGDGSALPVPEKEM